MNGWLAAALALMLLLAPLLPLCARARPVSGLVGLQLASVLGTLALALMAEGLHRQPFFDLSLALALLSLGGGLVFARFLERWE